MPGRPPQEKPIALAFLRSATLSSLALACASALAGGATSHFSCRITGASQLDHLAHDGQSARLTQFVCQVHGGPLDGFTASGTNIWEPGRNGAVLIGSVVVARKGDAAVVYEVQQATLSMRPDGPAGSWEAGGRGQYKLATGSAVALAGKSFRSVAHNDGPGAFSIDATVIE